MFYRQERFESAEFHFQRGIDINPSSSVLQCYLGMVLLARQKVDDAIVVLENACHKDQKNPQV